MISQFILPIAVLAGIFLGWAAYCLPAPKTAKFLFFLISLSGLVYVIPIGPVYNPAQNLPYALIVFLAALSTFSFYFLWAKIAHLALTVPLFVFGIFSKTVRTAAKNFFLSKKINVFCIAAALAAVIFCTWQSLRVPDVKHVYLTFKNLPQDLESYKIAQITDTHIGLVFQKDWLERTVQKVMAEQPDLIVHTGDIGDIRPQEIAEHLEPFKKLSAPDGVHYVFGNHEYYHNLSHWRQFFKDSGLHLLENDSVFLRKSLLLSGAKPFPKSKKELMAFPAKSDDVFHIYLDHHPQNFSLVSDSIDLQLSGHTHGGTVFFLSPVVAKFNDGFISGLYRSGEACLYINNGTGIWSYSPFRLFVPSEITVIHLSKGNA